jgi:hypothetical protein
MRPLVILCAVSLISVTGFAQRGGGHGGGGGGHAGGGGSHSSGFSRSGGGAVRSGAGGGYRYGGYRGYGYGRYGYPYYGLGWGAYGWAPYYYGWDNSAPYYDSSSYYGDSYNAGAYEQPPVIVNQVMPYAEPPAPPPPQPVMREYSGPSSAQSTNYGPVLYLFALKNNNILAAFTYWTEKGDLHYVNLDHQMKQIPLSSIDRDLTDRLNRERNLTVRLPG